MNQPIRRKAKSCSLSRLASGHEAGFTLVEVLVCISLIVLLIALLLPALETARGHAQMTRSVSNIHQIHLGLIQYAGDNKDQLMESTLNALWRDNFGMGSYIHYPSLLVLGGYVSDPFLFWGPMRDTRFLTPYRQVLQYPKGSNGDINYFAGYSLNQTGACPTERDQPMKPRTLGRPSRVDPGKLLLIGEMFDFQYYREARNWQDGVCWMTYCGNSGTTTQNFYTWHGYAARGYLDGHALAADSIDLGYDAIDPRNGTWVQFGLSYGLGEPWYDMYSSLNQ